MKHEVRLVVFDWAGTTVDYGCMAPLAVFERIFATRGIRLTREEILKSMGMGKRDHIAALLATEHAAKQWNERYGRDWTQTDVDEIFAQFNMELLSVLERYCTPIDGVTDVVAGLRQKKLAIGSTTGYTREMMDIVEAEAKRQGYAPDVTITSETMGFGRPYPYMMFENMKRFSVFPPCEAVKVGDTAADMLEGKHAGAWSVGILEGSSAANMSPELSETLPQEEKEARFLRAEDVFRQAGADYIIRFKKL